jgi:AdoMet-dependent heme synthase
MKDECPKSCSDAPRVPFRRLDALWFQVAGTICNLRCDHCFISCSPENDKFKFLSLEYCREMLTEGARLGVKEFYFTGGEPFANPAMCDILEAAAALAPSTVLTNATLFRESTLSRLKEINESAPHTIEMRVSIDGYNAEMNDPIRGQGTFEKAMQGVQDLCACGFRPIITITRTWCGPDDAVLAQFVAELESRGYEKPRLKILPSLKLGAEAERTRGYTECERVTHEMMCGFDTSQLVCSSARVVTDQGIWVCPILIDSPEANLGPSLSESSTDYPLRHQSCHTCWSNGAICSNATTSAPAAVKR